MSRIQLLLPTITRSGPSSARRRLALLVVSSTTAAALVLGGSVGAQAIERHPAPPRVGAASLLHHDTSTDAQRLALPEPAEWRRPDLLAASDFQLGFNFRDLIYVILTRHEQEVIVAALATGAEAAICARLGRFCTSITRFIFQQVIESVVKVCSDRWKFDILKPASSHCL